MIYVWLYLAATAIAFIGIAMATTETYESLCFKEERRAYIVGLAMLSSIVGMSAVLIAFLILNIGG